jgi:hypothetical protein
MQRNSGGRQHSVDQSRTEIRQVLLAIDARTLRQGIDMPVNARDGADPAHGLFQGIPRFGNVAPSPLQIEQTVDDGKVIGHAMLEFPKQQFALGELGIALIDNARGCGPKSLAGGNDREAGYKYETGRSTLKMAVRTRDQRNDEEPRQHFRGNQCSGAGLPAPYKSHQQRARIHECEWRSARNNDIDRETQKNREAYAK